MTATDKKGEYKLPNLDVGKYRLTIGRLVMDLVVEDPKEKKVRGSMMKKIIVFIPRSLDRHAKDKK